MESVLFLSVLFERGLGRDAVLCGCVASRSEARHEFIDPKGGCQQVHDLGMSGARRRGRPSFYIVFRFS